MAKVIFYTKEVCSLCDDAAALLSMFQQQYSFEIEVRDIYTKDEWLAEYQLLIPVVSMNGKEINCEEMSYRSEEHTSELQSRGHLVCRLLLEKKKKKELRLSRK